MLSRITEISSRAFFNKRSRSANTWSSVSSTCPSSAEGTKIFRIPIDFAVPTVADGRKILDNDVISSTTGNDDFSSILKSSYDTYDTSLGFFHITQPNRSHEFHFLFERFRHPLRHVPEDHI